MQAMSSSGLLIDTPEHCAGRTRHKTTACWWTEGKMARWGHELCHPRPPLSCHCRHPAVRPCRRQPASMGICVQLVRRAFLASFLLCMSE
jgi:hypothetical protein